MSKTIKQVIKKAESTYPGTSTRRSIEFSPLDSPCTSDLNQRLHEGPTSFVYNCDKKSLDNSKSSHFFYYESQEPRRTSDETVLLIEDYQSYDYSNTAGRQEVEVRREKSSTCCGRRKHSDEEVLTRPVFFEFEDDNELYVCRICHEGEDIEPLIQPCLCKGSVGNVHASCLKLWLEQSATSRCELCNFPYAIRQTKKYSRCYSVRVFFRTVVDRRSLTYDIISFVIITPLTLVGVAMCIQASIFSSSSGDIEASNQMGSITKVGMIMLSTTIAVAYTIWFYTLISYHYKSWKKWYSHCYDVEVIPVNMTSEERIEAARLLNEEMQRRQMSRDQGLIMTSLLHSSNSGNYAIYRRPSLTSPNPALTLMQPRR